MPSNKTTPYLFVILGATGDLTRRKLLPVLYRLSASGALGQRHAILGVDIDNKLDDRGYRALVCESLRGAGLPGSNQEISHWCNQYLHYHFIGPAGKRSYQGLSARIKALEQEHALAGNRIFHLAVPASAFPSVISGLGEANLNRSPGWTRLVVEKPFGRNLASAKELNQKIHRYFKESQIYRIDHFLGKETVQNLLAFRFANTFFEHLWSKDHVESVQITAAESLGLEGRSKYYEQAGALRDMVQNHLTQLMSLVAMEIPTALEAAAIRQEKLKVLGQIAPIHPQDVVLGQYTHGRVNGQEVVGYREEPGVAPDSGTETFVALRLEIANRRWKGVPFYLRTGKRMPHRHTHITVYFHCAPASIFHPFESSCGVKPNVLAIILQPDEGFDLHFQVKSPGEPFTLTTQRLHFRYSEAFGPLAEAYETLILDVTSGDQTLFVCDSEVEDAWRLYEGLLEKNIPVHPYPAGTWGPAEVDKLKAPWLNISTRKHP